MGWIGCRVISGLRREVSGKLLVLPIQFFDTQAAGPLLSRMLYNVEMVAGSVTTVVTVAVRDVLTVIAAFGVMIYISPKLTIFVAVLFPVVFTSRITFTQFGLSKSSLLRNGGASVAIFAVELSSSAAH